MENKRFTVRSKVGYDFGMGTRDFGVVGAFDTIAQAKAARDEHNASQRSNSGAVYAYAQIVDRDDEHTVVGFGHYGNGIRITSMRPIEAVSEADDVLFFGTRHACAQFAQSLA